MQRLLLIKSFCVTIEHAEFMSNYFNEHGISSMFLTGHSPDRVDLKKINKLIDSIENISDLRREFYKTILKERFEIILLESYNKLQLK